MHKFAHLITINGLFISTRRLCTSRFLGLNQNEQLSHASKSMYWNDRNEEKQTIEIFSYLFCILLHLLLFSNWSSELFQSIVEWEYYWRGSLGYLSLVPLFSAVVTIFSTLFTFFFKSLKNNLISHHFDIICFQTCR